MTASPGQVPRTRAPELIGRGWLNTEGPLRLRDLRGRFVLLDFWTFCCINCLHVIGELREVETAHRDSLVVIGVHSPKFVHEADPVALAQAVQRHHIEHPVLDDPELRTWQAYAARAWPTLVLIDPEGRVVAQYAGEGHAHAIDAMIRELAPSHELAPAGATSAVDRTPVGDLFFPAKAVRLPDNSLLVADAGNDRLTQLGADARRVLGSVGYAATSALDPGLRDPNGLCLLPDGVAAQVGYDVVVADTGNHRLVGLDSGVLASVDDAATPALDPIVGGLNSPWDVAWWRERIWVAMAGDHTLVSVDPRTGEVERIGGTTNEGLVDGPLAQAWFAQPSGLAPDGDRLWIADAETSALRWVEDGPDGLQVRTAIGQGLFDFGHRDGSREAARMQHPLGVAVHDGRVLIADTYNGAVRGYDPSTGHLTTLAQGLAEPSGFVVADQVLVVESAAHRIVPVELREAHVDGEVSRTQRPVTDVDRKVTLRIAFVAPPGQRVDERYGPAVQLQVGATPPSLLREGDGTATSLVRTLVLDPEVGEGVLHIAARAATCDADGGDGAACRLHQQDWGIPIRVSTDGSGEINLPLGGTR